VSLSRRLDKLEDSLTPTEAVIRWTRELREHESFPAYFAWLLHQPAELWPFERLTAQVARGAKARTKNLPAEEAAARVRQAQKDVVVLLVIHQIANIAVASELATQMTRTRHIFELLRELVQLDCMRSGLRRDRLSLPCPQLLPLETETLGRQLHLATRCRGEVAQGLLRVQVVALAAERLSSTYLHRHSLLYPDLRAGLTILRHTLAGQLRFFEELDLEGELEPEPDAVRNLAREGVGEKRISPPPTERPAEPGPSESALNDAAAELAHGVVLRARAEALHLLGDASASKSLLDQYLEAVRPGNCSHAVEAARKPSVKKKTSASGGHDAKTKPKFSGAVKTSANPRAATRRR
jgi:hypothetical protein